MGKHGKRAKRRAQHQQPPAPQSIAGPATVPGPVAASKRVFIAIPCGSGKPDYTTTLSINRALAEAGAHGWEATQMFRVWDSMITRARDVLLSQFLTTDCTDLMFWDDDVSCRPGTFARLMQHPVELVGGAYRGRKDPEEFVLRPLDNNILQMDPKLHLMEVAALGTGFMRITREAAEKMVAIDPDAWYHDPTAPKDLKIYSLFDNHFDRANRCKWSEDYWFCKRFRDIGGKVWVDPTFELDHAGNKVFRGQLLEYLQRTSTIPPGVTAPAQVKPSTLQLSKMFLEAAGPAA